MTIVPTTRDEAYEAGLDLGRNGGARLHDLIGQADDLGIPQSLRGSWLSGIEDACGGDPDSDSDGYGWERRALANL